MTLDYISYSQYNTYKQCPRAWYLSRMRKAEERQTWFLPVGTAVHQMIEAFIADPATSPRPEEFFYPLIRKQLKIQPDMDKWLSGGPKGDPTVKEKALEQVRVCFERAQELLSELDVWEVEYDATGSLPGLEVPVKAFVDIIGEHPKHGPVIVDWKTGMSKPKDNFQLETYKALLLNHFDEGQSEGDFKGIFALLNPEARKSIEGRPIDLSHVKPGQIGKIYQEVYDQMKKKDYRVNKSACYSCFYSESCLDKNPFSPQALYYDRSADEGYVF